MSDKRWVRTDFVGISNGELFESILEKLLKLKELQDKGEARNIYLMFDGEYADIQMVGERPETEKERSKRLKTEERLRQATKKSQERRKKSKEFQERQQYERLKEKFEPKHLNAEAHAKVMEKLKDSTPEQVLQSAKDSGIYDENGQLTKPYRSELEIFTETAKNLTPEQTKEIAIKGGILNQDGTLSDDYK